MDNTIHTSQIPQDHELDLRNTRKQEIYPLSDRFRGSNPQGHEIHFTNCFMQLDGKPFFGISGECHFSRVPENLWESTILKMKAGGLNVVVTYVFWIHHEEVEGTFRFDGRRNLRKFVQLCGKHHMYVILRIGPFDHGEVRNGGFPDWLYGKPFEVRNDNPGFMACARRLYHAISEQIDGLLYKDGGPVIAAQIDNEYMHSAAPWEMTTGISNEWITKGTEGNSYMLHLKKIAQEEGIITPFYTCTGWGGAATPTEELLPLWGGYAFWPWMYYGNPNYIHPATPEYLYRDNHNNAVPKTYNFEPFYAPESMPYACCEMGGGMSQNYYYRFSIPFESVDAMANIKLGSGCSFLGYYMYAGGINPRGEKAEFLNESQCPKFNYDYEAPIGAYGQIRPSFYRLKCIHQFLQNFGDRLLNLVTMLPADSQTIRPDDTVPLRFAARTDGRKGFVFINNYQDHAVCHDRENESIRLRLQDETIEMTGLSIKAGESAILPFHMDLDGTDLVWASAQPLAVIRSEDISTWYFFTPEGMKARYVFPDETVSSPDRVFTRSENGKMIKIVTLTREEALHFYEVDTKQGKKAVLSRDVLIQNGDKLILEREEKLDAKPEITWCGSSRCVIHIPDLPEDAEDVLMDILYSGDIGHLFDKNGTLLADDFCNQKGWENGLKELGIHAGDDLTLYMTPVRKDIKIDVSSTMAGRADDSDTDRAKLSDVWLKAVRRKNISLKELAQPGGKGLLTAGIRVL